VVYILQHSVRVNPMPEVKRSTLLEVAETITKPSLLPLQEHSLGGVASSTCPHRIAIGRAHSFAYADELFGALYINISSITHRLLSVNTVSRMLRTSRMTLYRLI